MFWARTSLAFPLVSSILSLMNAPDLRAQTPPQAQISNSLLNVQLYLPDAEKGYYRGTRFDWSGVIGNLEYDGHSYYGPWFTKTDPNVSDFIYSGDDIVAGPCSAISGPVEEFSSGESPLGFDEAKVGGSFLKIGVGMLRKPDEKNYSPFRLYEIANGGKWQVRTHKESVTFTQQLSDPNTGYAYVYTKTVRLSEGKPEMQIEHTLRNTGQRAIQTNVYDHNFLVLDKQATGPNYILTVPYQIKTERAMNEQLAIVRGNQIVYQKPLQGKETLAAHLSGFSRAPEEYNIVIENSKVGAGMKISGDRPLSRESLWSIRSVLAMEPFIDVSVQPGLEFTWTYTYMYYSLPKSDK
jgi:hypothetical protein